MNSSYSGSENGNNPLIEWVPCSSENRDSSRSEGKQSLFGKIENKILETSQKPNRPIKTIRVTERLSSTDLEWTNDTKTTQSSSLKTADLIRSIPDVTDNTHSVGDIRFQMQALDLSAIEKSSTLSSCDKTLTPRDVEIEKNEQLHLPNSSKLATKIQEFQNKSAATNTDDKIDSIENEINKDNEINEDTNISDDSMKDLIKALKKTVEDSQKARKEFEKQKLICESSLSKKQKQTKSHFRHNKPEAEMKRLLEHENELKLEKQKLIKHQYESHLQDLQIKQAIEQETKAPVRRSVPFPSAGGDNEPGPSKSNKKPKKRSDSKVLERPNLVIDDANMLEIITDEIPGWYL